MNRVALAAQDAQPAVAENTGSVGLAASTGTTPSKARAVAEPLAWTSRVDAGRGDEICIDLHNDGTLTIATAESIIELNSNQVMELGDFLHLTRKFWRP